MLNICAQRQSILDATGSVLVTGGPGCGKTTIALLKALQRIQAGLGVGQKVLFLSFSRAAVARIVEASNKQLPKKERNNLAIYTFHSFFWEIVRAYGYLLGAPRNLKLLLPHDEVALKRQHGNQNGNWALECERLFCEEGLVTFDSFATKVHDLFRLSQRIRTIYCNAYPLIIVDEAQDTAEDQWQSIKLLSFKSQLICLADLEQQIYDFRPGVSPDRVKHIMQALNPLRVDLQGENYRSPNSEIVSFANDILLNTLKAKKYLGVARYPFKPKADFRNKAIRQAVGIAIKEANLLAPEKIKSLAVLATWGRGVKILSQALVGKEEEKTISHQVMVDEAPIIMAGRMIAFLLEPRKSDEHLMEDLVTALSLAANVFLVKGSQGALQDADKFKKWEQECRAGKKLRANSTGMQLSNLLKQLQEYTFTGDPKEDWVFVRRKLYDAGSSQLKNIAKEADHLVMLQRSNKILNNLIELWQSQNNYKNARQALDDALSQEILMSDDSTQYGIHVMTIHKSKGKEFDAVIIIDDAHNSPLISTPSEQPPFTRSRRLLRVGITRARHFVLLLTDMYNPSCLISKFK